MSLKISWIFSETNELHFRFKVEISEGTLKLYNVVPCDGFYFYLVLDTLNFSRKVPVPGGRH